MWIIAGANVVGGFVLVPLSLLVERPWEHWQTCLSWLVVLYGAVPSTLGHLWFYSVIRTLGASRTVTFLNPMPFAVLGLSWALVGETIHGYRVWLARRWSWLASTSPRARPEPGAWSAAAPSACRP